MSKRSRFANIAIFCLRFAVFAPICLYVWWWLLLPPYAYVLGQISSVCINLFTDAPIIAMKVVPNENSVLNADTNLRYITAERQLRFEISYLVDSLPPFIILVLATPGLKFLRRLKVLAIGAGLYFAGQVLYITGFYLFSSSLAKSAEIGIALGQFWLTLPFIMWIVLVYWERILPRDPQPAASNGGEDG